MVLVPEDDGDDGGGRGSGFRRDSLVDGLWRGSGSEFACA